MLLLFGVAALSASSKESLYHFDSSSAQLLNASTKMQVAPAPLFLSTEPLSAVARVIPTQPAVSFQRYTVPPVPLFQEFEHIGSLQRRPPPSFIS